MCGYGAGPCVSSTGCHEPPRAGPTPAGSRSPRRAYLIILERYRGQDVRAAGRHCAWEPDTHAAEQSRAEMRRPQGRRASATAVLNHSAAPAGTHPPAARKCAFKLCLGFLTGNICGLDNKLHLLRSVEGRSDCTHPPLFPCVLSVTTNDCIE